MFMISARVCYHVGQPPLPSAMLLPQYGSVRGAVAHAAVGLGAAPLPPAMGPPQHRSGQQDGGYDDGDDVAMY